MRLLDLSVTELDQHWDDCWFHMADLKIVIKYKGETKNIDLA